MKARKILYFFAGLINVILGGCGTLLGLLVFLFGGTLRATFNSTKEIVVEFVEELAGADSKYDYLRDYSHEEVVDFIMRLAKITGIVLILLGLIFIMFGVFNFLLKKRHDSVLGGRKYLKIIFVVSSWILLILNVANILTTVAVFLKDKKQEKLYVSSEKS